MVRDVTKKGFDPPRIVVGSEKENPVRLSRQDWRGPKAGWAADSVGHWEVTVERAGRYEVTIRCRHGVRRRTRRAVADHSVRGWRTRTGRVRRDDRDDRAARPGTARVEVTVGRTLDGEEPRGPTYVELEYVGPVEAK